MADLGYAAFDADNHYYEAEDAFIRHIDPKMQKRCMQWAEMGGKQRLLVGGKINRFIPNPTFDPVAKPGVLDAYFRGKNPEAQDIRTLFGDLEPIPAAYRDRDARLALMDEQNLAGAFLFPTLGVGMEEALVNDPEAVLAAFRAFNLWVEEDWGFNYEDRLFAAPYISLIDVDWAVEQLEFALEHDARIVCLRAGPVKHAAGSCSIADPRHDPFWARANEAGITIAFHAGDAGYRRYAVDWGEPAEFQSFVYSALPMCLSANPIRDTMAAMLCGQLFDRHPNLRIATIESGSSWVPPLLASLKKAHSQMPFAFKTDPIERFREHVFVSPYYEDDIEGLRNTLGAEHILFGSDFPHAEGLANPTDFIYDLKGFDQDEVRLAMRENSLGLIQRRPA